MFMKEHFYFDESVKFNKFQKNNLENIEILSSAGFFFRITYIGDVASYHGSVFSTGSHILG